MKEEKNEGRSEGRKEGTKEGAKKETIPIPAYCGCQMQNCGIVVQPVKQKKNFNKFDANTLLNDSSFSHRENIKNESFASFYQENKRVWW